MRDEIDPKGLIREAYRIEGIGRPECRSIFLDWALSLPDGVDATDAIGRLMARHAAEPQDHPMTETLAEGRREADLPRRRGGRRGRLS